MIRSDEPDGPSGEGVPGVIGRHALGRRILEVGDGRVVTEHDTIQGGRRCGRSRWRGCRCPRLRAGGAEEIPVEHHVVAARGWEPLRGGVRYRYGGATRWAGAWRGRCHPGRQLSDDVCDRRERDGSQEHPQKRVPRAEQRSNLPRLDVDVEEASPAAPPRRRSLRHDSRWHRWAPTRQRPPMLLEHTSHEAQPHLLPTVDDPLIDHGRRRVRGRVIHPYPPSPRRHRADRRRYTRRSLRKSAGPPSYSQGRPWC